MKVLQEGHSYGLAYFENPKRMQVIQFIDRRPVTHDATGKMFTEKDGTTNEEVLEMMIDRISYLNDKSHSDYNDLALIHLEAALSNLNKRNADRKERGVEGLAKK